MAFLDILQEVLGDPASRSLVSDLARNVAIVSVDREKEGNPRKFLNINYAKNGEIEWVSMESPGIFILKGKFMKEVLPKIQNQKVGRVKFVDRDSIRDELGYGSVGAIQSDSPSVGFSKAEVGGVE